MIDLAVVSVLLDAGAGPHWHYDEAASGQTFTRSEGLGVASLHAFTSGMFSSDPDDPLRADAAGLLELDAATLAEAFQVTPSNPLVGLDGRLRLLHRLGDALAAQPDAFGTLGRPGGLFDALGAAGGSIDAHDVLTLLLTSLSGIWLADNAIGDVDLGDCWRHRDVGGPGLTAGWVPFHKLSQWLTYSLLEPLDWAGVTVGNLDALTGLPEYRNGGLLLDTGVLVLRDPTVAARTWTPADELVVEWRALTVGPARRTRPPGSRRTGHRCPTDTAGMRSRGRHLGRGPRHRGTTPGRVAAADDRQRRDGVLNVTAVHLVDHPLVQHKLTLMRRKEASTNSFRQLLHEASALMAYEVLRDMPMHDIEIETPLEHTTGRVIDGKKLVFVSILRAGSGILDGMLSVVPGARVGHIGLYRDPKTLVAVEYYFKLPADLHERDVVVVDPMLATGNSAVAAVERLKEARPKSIKFVCLLTCPEGIAVMQQAHPDVPIYTAAVDRELDEHGYIVPGLGDAGDRIFGTK